MKTVIALLVVVVLIAAVWALAFFQVIPAQKLADKTPALARVLITLRVAKARPKAMPKHLVVAVAPPAPSVSPEQLDAEKAALATEKQQLDAEKAILDKKMASASGSSSDTPGDTSAGSATPKLISIYSTMKSDDIARIFAKLPDSAVVDALAQLDDRQAGKILAALPDDRAAKITALMGHVKPAATTQ